MPKFFYAQNPQILNLVKAKFDHTFYIMLLPRAAKINIVWHKNLV